MNYRILSKSCHPNVRKILSFRGNKNQNEQNGRGWRTFRYTDKALERMAKLWNAFVRKVSWYNGGFEFTVRTTVRDYRVYKDTWTTTIGKEFVCSQELANGHGAHAVAVYGNGDKVLGHLPRELSCVAGRRHSRLLHCCDEILEALHVWWTNRVVTNIRTLEIRQELEYVSTIFLQLTDFRMTNL